MTTSAFSPGILTGAASTGAVTTRPRDQGAVITLDDGKANALSLDLLADLERAVEQGAEGAGALVLAGRHGFFSAGLDRAVIDQRDPVHFETVMEAARCLYRAMLRAPVPIVAACTGHALAAGALLVLCSDLRIGARGPYKIGLTEVSIGLALPEFGFTLARERLDRRVLLRATVLAETYSPDEAAEVGFLDEVFDDDLIERAVERAGTLATLPTAALSTTRSRLYASLV